MRAKYSHLCAKEACFSVIQAVRSLQDECIVNWYQRSCSSIIDLPEKKAKGRKFTLQSHRSAVQKLDFILCDLEVDMSCSPK